jgi:pimeloyl-ACP methyl ester carboxylesterase
MQTLRVNGYDIAYLEIGHGPPLVCVHGTLGDFRSWSAVMGPLSKTRRVIAPSLRHFFPEHWNGVGDDYLMSQHVDDTIGFIAQIDPGPVDLMGHSRGGHIAFRVAQHRPDLLRKLVLLEPGGDLDASLSPAAATSSAPPQASRIAISAKRIASGDIDGALQNFFDGIDGDGAWARLPAAPRQQLRDNVFTLLGQIGENRKPFGKTEAQAIRTPTLLIGGAETRGALSIIWRVLSEHIPDARTAVIPGARHWMFDQAPRLFSQIVLEFLGD